MTQFEFVNKLVLWPPYLRDCGPRLLSRATCTLNQQTGQKLFNWIGTNYSVRDRRIGQNELASTHDTV